MPLISFIRPRWITGSLVLHAMVFALIFEATRASANIPQVTVADTTLLFFPRLAPPAVRPAEMEHPGGAEVAAGAQGH